MTPAVHILLKIVAVEDDLGKWVVQQYHNFLGDLQVHSLL
jgi:hypothetical protein